MGHTVAGEDSCVTVRILQGDCREVLKTLPAESVHCVVCSPPYWGLRDYGTGTWEVGDHGCDHMRSYGSNMAKSTLTSAGIGATVEGAASKAHASMYRALCGKCGASRVDRQLGIEPTPEEHVANMVDVFREVRRVLRLDGTCWINYGDLYANNGCGGGSVFDNGRNDGRTFYEKDKVRGREATKLSRIPSGLKPKDLVGMPWRVAFALQADGWWLRSDIIWSKLNPMPESVTDRPTKSHEYVFLLTKSARYFYDAEAVRETAEYGRCEQPSKTWDRCGGSRVKGTTKGRDPSAGRNLRSVWTIATHAYSEAHFATFPPKLAETCIKAGTSEKGCCPACGAPWVRMVKTDSSANKRNERIADYDIPGIEKRSAADRARRLDGKNYEHVRKPTNIWQQSCACFSNSTQNIPENIPCTILDPFAGAGTTLMVADRLQRHAIGIDLNTEYVEMQLNRLRKDAGMFADISVTL